MVPRCRSSDKGKIARSRHAIHHAGSVQLILMVRKEGLFIALRLQISGENAKILSECMHVVLVNKTVTYFDFFVGPFKRRDMSLMTRVPNFIL